MTSSDSEYDDGPLAFADNADTGDTSIDTLLALVRDVLAPERRREDGAPG